MENDIPNYIAIPVSILGGFLISYVIRRFYPTSVEEHQIKNQTFLLSKCFFPIYESLYFINRGLAIHETYDDYRNHRAKYHDEDEKEITYLLKSFYREKERIKEINSNSVGEVFYNALSEYFVHGAFLISQGYSEPKFFTITCRSLEIILKDLEPIREAYGATESGFDLISDGEVVDLSDHL
jgi:hypothetical protein